MTLIQTILRSAAPALVMAAMFAAAPANASDDTKAPSNNRGAIIDFATCAKPQYPAAAIKEKRTGTVTLGFLVDTDGIVVDSKVGISSGYDDLDQTARDAIKLCKFSPAIKDGKHAKEWTPLRYKWTLE